MQMLAIPNKRHLSYMGHINRSKTTDQMSTALMGKVEGQRILGIPPTSFISNITNVFCLRLTELIHRGREREEWMNLVESYGSPNIDPSDSDEFLKRYIYINTYVFNEYHFLN